MKYDIKIIRQEAHGRWDQILYSLAPDLGPALNKPGRHVPCPVHGGKDGFRVYRNSDINGASVCNTCGEMKDGFETLMWVNGWSFYQALQEVGKYLLPHYSDEKVISSELVNLEFTGKVISSGKEKGEYGENYALTLEDPNHRKYRHWGSCLEQAIKRAQIKVGDNCHLELVSKQTVKKGDVTFKRNNWIARRLESDEERTKRLAKEAAENEYRLRSMYQLWKSGTPISQVSPDNPVFLYFERRGLIIKEDAGEAYQCLRYAPTLTYRHEDGTKTTHPGLIAIVRNRKGQCANIQRTFLTEEGRKANVESPKKLMSQPANVELLGSAIRIGGMPGKSICVAEGIETSYSVHMATGLPCWSTVTAIGMQNVELPECAQEVYIFADKDVSETGKKSAEILAKRLRSEGRNAYVILPDDPIPEGSKGIDWNDILLLKGVDGFPDLTKFKACEGS
ncbi:MAG: toprim domain-containing protein [Burkholderiales bacterium]|nr:toprim domain-containing protein [Burkholderiales bacterium]